MLLKLEDMTVEQKIGFVLCARRFEEDDIDFTLELIKNKALGCVQAPAEKPELVKKLLDAADYPILVINDTERGFPTSDLPKIPLMSLAACDKKEYYTAFAKGIVRDAKKSGFNGTWGPVIDVLRGDGPCRVYRNFSDNPDKVSQAAEIIAQVYKDNGYLSTGKHYPGGHDCPFDTHMTEGASELDEKDLEEFDLAPYIYLHKKGLLPCIMTGHNLFPKIDPDYPASLSKKIIDIIRNKGFDGVAFTDSFAMMGILQKYGEENVYGLAVAAGNDIILTNFRTPTRDCYNMLLKNYKDGLFSEERLNEAVARVLKAQEFVYNTRNITADFTAEDEKLLNDIAKDCITEVSDENPPCLGDDRDDRMFVILTDNGFSDENGTPEIETGAWFNPITCRDRIKELYPSAHIEFLPEFSGQMDNYRVLTTAANYKEVIFITFCTTTSYLGTDGFTRRTESVINGLIHSGKVPAIVHFGNPFALTTLWHIPKKIFGYMIPDSQKFAIDVLKGLIPASGHLPFDVNFN